MVELFLGSVVKYAEFGGAEFSALVGSSRQPDRHIEINMVEKLKTVFNIFVESFIIRTSFIKFLINVKKKQTLSSVVGKKDAF